MMAVEAMACGVPVIVADGTSLPGVVKAPDVGVSVPQGDPEALAAAIDSLLADPVARRRRGHASRELVEREYSFDQYLSAHLQLYRDVSGRSSRWMPAWGSAPRRWRRGGMPPTCYTTRHGIGQ